MKNTMLGKVVSVIILVVLAGMLIYFYVTLNRMDKKMSELQTTTVENSNSISEVVNFFNTNINAQGNQ